MQSQWCLLVKMKAQQSSWEQLGFFCGEPSHSIASCPTWGWKKGHPPMDPTREPPHLYITSVDHAGKKCLWLYSTDRLQSSKPTSQSNHSTQAHGTTTSRFFPMHITNSKMFLVAYLCTIPMTCTVNLLPGTTPQSWTIGDGEVCSGDTPAGLYLATHRTSLSQVWFCWEEGRDCANALNIGD